MTRRPTTIRQDEIKRAVAGAQAGGLVVDRVEVDPASGKLVIIARGATGASGNPWDALRK